jgi:hypothetical protein
MISAKMVEYRVGVTTFECLLDPDDGMSGKRLGALVNYDN